MSRKRNARTGQTVSTRQRVGRIAARSGREAASQWALTRGQLAGWEGGSLVIRSQS